MSERNAKAILTDIVTNIEIIMEFTEGMDKKSFLEDVKTQYAVD